MPASAEYLRGLREICDEHGIVLIADEVQSGFGRTGRMFAMEHFGVEPDLVCVAKSIAGGLPISGVLGRASVMDAPDDSTIGGTFVGNPLGCEAAVAVLDVIAEEGLLARGMEIGDRLRAAYESLQDPMLGVEFVREGDGAPDAELASRIVGEALSRGLILLKAGLDGNVIRTLVPLVISDADLDEAIAVFDAAVTSATAAVIA